MVQRALTALVKDLGSGSYSYISDSKPPITPVPGSPMPSDL